MESFSYYSPVKIGDLELAGNLFLAPMAGYTDRIYRCICRENGADFSFTELVSAEGLLRGGKASIKLIERGNEAGPYAIQLFGHDPESIYRAAIGLAPYKPDMLDINSGCPVPKVVKHGGGSALMKNPLLLGKIIESAVRASEEALGNIPVSVKIRSGWDSQSINYGECARIACEAGAKMISLHPRTRSQFYGGKSDWLHITDLVSRTNIPITGSGDLYTPEDAERMFKETGCKAIMFARGAIGNPFIFSVTKDYLVKGSRNEKSFSEKTEAAICHLELLAEEIGEKAACKEMRKHFSAYTKGEKGSASLRNKIVGASTINEYKQILGIE